MKELKFKWVEHNSADYDRSVKLRDLVLRKPLNMVFTQEQLDAETDEFHLIAILNDDVVGCLVLKPDNHMQIQMRQVAVHPDFQRRGIGAMLVHQSELKAKALNIEKLFLHARDVAVAFYKSLNYKIEGDSFMEVGIVHYHMFKEL